MDKKLSTAIIGVGELGSAIGGMLVKADHTSVELWDKDESKMPEKKSLDEVVSGKDAIMLCVPSFAVREIVEMLGSRAGEGTVVMSFAKGLEKDTQKTMDEVLTELLPGKLSILIGGPMLAEELDEGLPGAAAAAGGRSAFEVAELLFKGTKLRLIHSDDRLGVAWAGVLKNVYAIGLGVWDELGMGSNARGWYMQQAVKEMAEIIERLGGQRETAYGSAGLGDLVATGMSRFSSNYETGRSLGRGIEPEIYSEGMRSMKSVGERIGQFDVEWEIMDMVMDITLNKASSRKRAEKMFCE